MADDDGGMSSAPRSETDVAREGRQEAIDGLIRSVGGDPSTFDGRLIRELVDTCLKMIPDGHDTGQLKLINSALKEMRYAYGVFNRYVGARKISIFGSARTPEDHADYVAARDFSRRDRVRYALYNMGTSVVSGAITTGS